MILVDYREKPNRREKTELVSLINKIGVKAETADLLYGDFAFDGFDDDGGISIGVERKRLHDMLACIDDSRFSAHQRIGMGKFYQESWLLIEGVFRPHDPKGLLMEGDDNGGWWYCKPGGAHVLYSKLRRYLFSIQRSGMPILYTRSMWHTAYDIVELYHYYQKRKHTSMLDIHKPAIATLTSKAPLVRKWAEDLEGIGQTHGVAAARLFKTPIALANSEPYEWMGIPRIGEKTAEDIYRQIQGFKR